MAKVLLETHLGDALKRERPVPESSADEDRRQGYARARALLFNEDWKGAVRLARNLARSDPLQWRAAIQAGGTFIDAGAAYKKREWLIEGVDLLTREIQNVPVAGRHLAHYNLGNAYLTLGQRERGSGPCTKPSLSEAVSQFDEALAEESPPDYRINLAAALRDQGRLIEALDELNDVIRDYPEKHEASANRALILGKVHSHMNPHQGLLQMALRDISRARELVGKDPHLERAYRSMQQQLSSKAGNANLRHGKQSRTTRWIAENGLNLNPCPLCLIETPEAFDTYSLAGHLSGGRRRPSEQETLDMVNAIHRSYSSARWILLSAAGVGSRPPADHVVTATGAADADHSLRTGLLLDAAAGFYNVLNQVASCVNAYLHLGHPRRKLDLARLWSKPSRRARVPIPLLRADLHPGVTRVASPMLSALYRLALSLEHGSGRYSHLRSLRNRIVHGVVVVRGEADASSYYEVVAKDDLLSDVVKLGRVSKAAVLYLGAMIWRAEYERLKRAKRKGDAVGYGHHPVDRR